MRKDIYINTSLGEMVLSDQNKLDTYPFKWVSETDRFILGEITIPHNFDVRKLQTEGVKVEIPYTPIYKPIKIRILRNYDINTNVSIVNPVNGGDLFEVSTSLWHQKKMQICASQLIMIHPTSYLIQIDNKNGTAQIWSAIDSDAVKILANEQNKNLLLRCVPTNNYRYPTSGVGLIRYLHANLVQTDLAHVLQSEFKADKVIVNHAAFNAFTGDIDLDLDYSEADGNI